MPLSEDEQRILSEIEQQLRETDPGLARDIADTTVYTAASRGLNGRHSVLPSDSFSWSCYLAHRFFWPLADSSSCLFRRLRLSAMGVALAKSECSK